MNVSIPVSIALVIVGLVVLAIVLIVYLVHKWIKRSKQNESCSVVLFDQDNCINYCLSNTLSESMDLTTANTNDNVSHKEVKDEDKIGTRRLEITPNPPQGTMACSEELIN